MYLILCLKFWCLNSSSIWLEYHLPFFHLKSWKLALEYFILKNYIIQTKKLKCCLKVWIFPTLILYRKEICCRCSSGLYCGNRSISDSLSVPPRFISSKWDMAYVPLFVTKLKHTGSPLKQHWDLYWWLFLRHIMRNCKETAAEPIILLTFNILNIWPTLVKIQKTHLTWASWFWINSLIGFIW